jgi:hypothetical protein
MRVDYDNPRVVAALRAAPANVRNAFFKQIGFLASNVRHPSLRTKKFDETQDLWQARINGAWRFYFVIRDDTCIVLDVIAHPK